MRALTYSLPLLSLIASLPAFAQLNDTGQAKCSNGSALVACTAANAGDSGLYNRQDARFGRDAAAGVGQLAKTGGGVAGFDFTPLDSDGNAIALDGSGNPVSTPACVHDNVTNLTWEVKTTDSGLHDKSWTYTWYDGTNGGTGSDTCGGTLSGYANQCNTNNYVAATNAAGLCGYHTLWRMPTVRELSSIVNFGAYFPAIDTHYFPNTAENALYWASNPHVFYSWLAWGIHFFNGESSSDTNTNANAVRLVRGGI